MQSVQLVPVTPSVFRNTGSKVARSQVDSAQVSLLRWGREQDTGRDGWLLPRPLHMGVPVVGLGSPGWDSAGMAVFGPDGADSH